MKSEELLVPENLKILSEIDQSPEYQTYYKWFLSFTQIPHPTFKCVQIAQKVCEWLDKLNVKYQKDDDLNIVVNLPASKGKENSPVLAIQTHLDMVWVGEEVDGRIKVELDKNYKISNEKSIEVLRAPKSTLGADDAFGIALCFDIIENRDKFTHGPLELIMTSDEEEGLIGVKKLPKKDDTSGKISPFKFKYLLNCDCLSSDKIYVGCPGCEKFDVKLHPTFELIDKDIENKIEVVIKLDNFRGGHSGNTIHQGQANPIKWIAHILNVLKSKKIEYQITTINGGQKMNAIPTSCHCSFLIDIKHKDEIDTIINSTLKDLKADFYPKEPNICCLIQYNNLSKPTNALTKKDSINIINILTIIRHGILRMHPIFEDKVDSSNNLAKIDLTYNKDEAQIDLICLSRGSTNTEFDKIENAMRSIFELCPIKNEFSTYTGSRPWPAKQSSKLADTIKKVAKDEYNLELEYGLTQVTIECPIFLNLGYNDADIVSFCSNIPLAHCVGEFLDINESIRYRNIIYKTIENLA
jgi:dipeptidase D